MAGNASEGVGGFLSGIADKFSGITDKFSGITDKVYNPKKGGIQWGSVGGLLVGGLLANTLTASLGPVVSIIATLLGGAAMAFLGDMLFDKKDAPAEAHASSSHHNRHRRSRAIVKEVSAHQAQAHATHEGPHTSHHKAETATEHHTHKAHHHHKHHHRHASATHADEPAELSVEHLKASIDAETKALKANEDALLKIEAPKTPSVSQGKGSNKSQHAP